MSQVTHFEAEQIGEYILLSMEVTSGDNVWPGRKCVAADADLKAEGETLAKEIVDANTTGVVAETSPEPIPVDVSGITIVL